MQIALIISEQTYDNMDKLRLHIEQITPVSDEEFEFIKSFFTLKKVRKNQYLIQEGEEVKYEYLVLSGIYKVFYTDDRGKEYVCCSHRKTGGCLTIILILIKRRQLCTLNV
ncbi:DNA-dependent RNA polymerase auxiliary subunit epsilon [Chitinophagaceae bacterium OAS944]|nr:DNA-dependent RNA polymerase auxiliary subunit epsilon [Chitinophagaceae bacterium OAS944]